MVIGRFWTKWLLLLGLLCLSACLRETALEDRVDKAEVETAKNIITQIKSGRHEELLVKFDPALKNAEAKLSLQQMADLMPAESATSVRLVGYQWSTVNNLTDKNFTLELAYPSVFLLAKLSLREQAGQQYIMGLSLKPQSASLASQHRFTFNGKPFLAYVFFCLTCLIPVFVAYALYTCLRMKMNRKKWPWVLAILLGFGKLSLNWSSGVVYFQLLVIQLFSASAVAEYYGPWMLSVSLPVGAIIFFLKRDELRAEAIPDEKPQLIQHDA